MGSFSLQTEHLSKMRENTRPQQHVCVQHWTSIINDWARRKNMQHCVFHLILSVRDDLRFLETFVNLTTERSIVFLWWCKWNWKKTHSRAVWILINAILKRSIFMIAWPCLSISEKAMKNKEMLTCWQRKSLALISARPGWDWTAELSSAILFKWYKYIMLLSPVSFRDKVCATVHMFEAWDCFGIAAGCGNRTGLGCTLRLGLRVILENTTELWQSGLIRFGNFLWNSCN